MTPLEAGLSQLGVREATGHNDGVPAQRYNHGEDKAWCAAFVAWCFEQADSPLPGNKYNLASVRYMEDQLTIAGKWWVRARPSQYAPAAGDIVFFANRDGSDRGVGRHVGLVEKFEGGRVHTIEGNRGNAVARADYDQDDRRIVGYARWPV